MSDYPSYEVLGKDLIVAFSKMGLKHDVLLHIHGLKQKRNESMRDCANCLLQYISRGLARNMSSLEKLISLFLEGLLNKSFHASLYGWIHETLNECIKDAIDFDENYKIYGNVDKKIHSPSKNSSVKSGKTQETS